MLSIIDTCTGESFIIVFILNMIAIIYILLCVLRSLPNEKDTLRRDSKMAGLSCLTDVETGRIVGVKLK